MTITQKLDREQILQLAGGYRFLAVLGAAAELNLFTLLGDESLPAEPIAIRLRSNLRATTVLLDALAALGLLEKQGESYSVPADLRPWLSENTPGTALPMVLAPDEPDSHVVAVGVDRPQRRAGSAAGEHPRGRGRSGRLHRRHAQHLRSDRRRSRGPARSAQVPSSARRGRGLRHLDAGLPPRRAWLAGDDLRSARRHRTGPRADRQERLSRPRGSCGGRFL